MRPAKLGRDPRPSPSCTACCEVVRGNLFDLEAEKGLSGRFKYCLFPSHDGSTRVRAVPEAPGSFASRKALPAPWRGVRDDALSTQIGIDGAIFVHNSGFIGGNKTFEGAMAMARAGILFED